MKLLYGTRLKITTTLAPVVLFALNVCTTHCDYAADDLAAVSPHARTPDMADTLSEELLATIFSYLSAPEILTAAAVSKNWRAAAHTSTSWSRLLAALPPSLSVCPLAANFEGGIEEYRRLCRGVYVKSCGRKLAEDKKSSHFHVRINPRTNSVTLSVNYPWSL